MVRGRIATSIVTALMLVSAAAAAQNATHPATPSRKPAVDPGANRTVPTPFSTSLQIMPPGPQAEPEGLNYTLRLGWSARNGAAEYRVLTWTDAARMWYVIARTAATHADVHAFRSGCTEFTVIAVGDTSAGAHTAPGERASAYLDTTNVLRFPFSEKPQICPFQRSR
jgi:hypothetical protein